MGMVKTMGIAANTIMLAGTTKAACKASAGKVEPATPTSYVQPTPSSTGAAAADVSSYTVAAPVAGAMTGTIDLSLWESKALEVASTNKMAATVSFTNKYTAAVVNADEVQNSVCLKVFTTQWLCAVAESVIATSAPSLSITTTGYLFTTGTEPAVADFTADVSLINNASGKDMTLGKDTLVKYAQVSKIKTKATQQGLIASVPSSTAGDNMLFQD